MRHVRRLFKKVKSRLAKLQPPKKRGRPKKRPPLPYRKVGTLLIAVGIFVVLFPFIFENANQLISRHNVTKSPDNVATSSNTTPNNPGPIRIDPALLSLKEPSQPPERIVVPSQGINLPVVEAPVVNGYWELSNNSASHGVGSANPGEKGNIVIFAHAFEGLFLPLRNVQIGAEVIVLTKDHWYRYQITQTKEVSPDQIEVIAPTPDETLTLYTCSGFLDSKRLIVTAKPLS